MGDVYCGFVTETRFKESRAENYFLNVYFTVSNGNWLIKPHSRKVSLCLYKQLLYHTVIMVRKITVTDAIYCTKSYYDTVAFYSHG